MSKVITRNVEMKIEFADDTPDEEIELVSKAEIVMTNTPWGWKVQFKRKRDDTTDHKEK